MAFSLLFPGGLAFGERLPAAFVNSFDANLASAVDGVGGGTYTPSSAIVIGGSGLQLTGAFEALGDTTIGNAAGDALTVVATSTFDSPATFDGTTTFNNQATFNGALITTGNTTIGDASTDTCTIYAGLTVRNDCTLGLTSGDTLTVNADTTFEGPVTFENDISFGGTLSIAGVVTLENDVTLGTNASDVIDIIGRVRIGRRLEFQNAGTGVGRVPLRVMTLPDASTSVSIADGNYFRVPTGLTSNPDYTISDTGAVDGDFMVFFQGRTQTPGQNVTFNSPTTGQDVTISSGDEMMRVIFVRVSGDWLCTQISFL